MLQLLRDYLAYKRLKTGLVVSTFNELQHRAATVGVGDMTLMELAQLDYMYQQVYKLEHNGRALSGLRATAPSSPSEGEDVSGMYL